MHADGPTERLGRGRLAHAAALLAESLFDDPAYAFVFPDARTRRVGLERFFRLHLGNHLLHRCTFVDDTEDLPVAATVTLRPPGGIRVTRLAQLTAASKFVAAVGPGPLKRLLQIARLYEELERAAAGGRPYWHVHMMAVAPSRRGRGVGRALLERALDTRAGATEPVVLTTHKPLNVRFYERAGFRVVAEQRVAPDRRQGHPVWSMRRDRA